MDEIFRCRPSIYNSNKVVAGLQESSTTLSNENSISPRIAPSSMKTPAMDTTSEEENFIHIKNENPKQNVVETKKPLSSQDKILGDLAANSHKMNDYKIIIRMPPTL